MNRRTVFVLTAALMGLWTVTTAQDATRPNAVRAADQASPVSRSPFTSSSDALAARYGLSTDEWARYQSFVGPGPALWPATLHPLEVLGREAANDAEMRVYAERWAMLRYTKLKKSQRFRAVFSDVWMTRYGKAAYDEFVASISRGSYSAAHRLVVFVEDDCPACTQKVNELRFAVQRGDAAGLDLYFVGAGDDEAIRAWAKRQGIPTGQVSSGRITLNHDNGTLLSLGHANARLPLVLKSSPDGQVSYLTASPVPAR